MLLNLNSNEIKIFELNIRVNLTKKFNIIQNSIRVKFFQIIGQLRSELKID